MPLISDPTSLSNTNGVDINVDVAAKTIEILTTGSVTDEGATGGVTGQCLYSYLKERWKADATFIKYPFPMEAITPEQFEFINDWVPANDATRKLIRTAGWAERTAAGAVEREYIGVVSLGSIGATDQPYYEFINNGTSVGAQDFTYAGPVNEGVQVFGDATNGNFDYRETADVFNIFCREAGKTYAASSSTAVGATTLTYITYRFPLSNGTDLSISATDADITRTASVTSASFSGGTATYSATGHGFSIGDSVTISGMLPSGYNVTGDITAVPDANSFQLTIPDPGSASTQGGTVNSIHAGITIGYYNAGQAYDVNQDTTNEAYSVVITDASGVATTQQIYEAVQYLLRSTGNINVDGDAGSLVGRVQSVLLNFVGDTLETGTAYDITGDGVYIDGLNSSFYAVVKFKADDGVFYLFPKVASGTIQFGGFAGSGDFKYFMFFRTGAGAYGAAGAELVDDNSGADITGTYAGTDVAFDFAYTKNTQNSRTADTDVPITLVGIGTDGGQFIKVDYTIVEGSGNNFLLAPAQERNYDNP